MSPKLSSWPKRLRAGLRFSLRTLLATTLVAALLFAWFGWRLRKSQRQARAVAVLQQLGALYAYDYQGPIVRSAARFRYGDLVVTPGQSRYPDRLQNLLGVDFLHNINRVHLETSYRLADEDIDRLWNALGDLPDLIYLEASGPVTRPGVIRRLQSPRKLQRLALRWANIADDDLAVLARMPRLEELNLNETPVSSRATPHIARTQSLRELELHHTKIDDGGLGHLAKLPRLTRLRLSGSPIGDAGIKHLVSLQSLTDLNLEYTKISDEAFSAIAAFAKLQRLDISLTQAADEGILQLTSLKELKQLRLDLTAAGPGALAALPKLAALEELEIGGPIAMGDLSPLARCANLRVLALAPRSIRPPTQALMLPPTIEEIRGIALDSSTYDFFCSLPNLKVVHASQSLMLGADRQVLQDFQNAHPRVQVVFH